MKLALLVGLGSLFIYHASYANVVCNIVPSCESLGYSKKESDCAEDVLLMLKCPFDDSMAYCPEDCKNYPLLSVNYKKGSYVKCATASRYKYTSCNDGYVMSDNDCVPELCDSNTYIYKDKPDETKGEIVSCKTGEYTRYGYSSCNEGWELDGANCVEKDCGPDYVFLSECPANAECTDKCMSGLTEKINFTCNDGLTRQRNKCVKNEIGSIYKYKGQPIGVVFYEDDSIIKIIALHDIDQDGQPIEIPDSDKAMVWATPDSKNCTGIFVDTAYEKEGSKSTQILLDFAGWKDETSKPTCWTRAAIATRLYHPEVCEDDSFCGKGKWYLPSKKELGDFFYLYDRDLGIFIHNVFNETDNGLIPLSHTYWTSTQRYNRTSLAEKYYATIYGGSHCNEHSTVMSSKTDLNYVRPMLVIENSSLEE